MGKLYVVATPIGNLGDITLRAITVLKEVALIAAEDTRQSRKLLTHYGIGTRLLSVHAHNERTHSVKILDLLSNDEDVAYITDAGTPAISDPGSYLVKSARAHGFPVIPIPGPCAAVAALSVSGIGDPHFYFEGFLPNKSVSRKQRLLALKSLPCTLIFYESPHRILDSMTDIIEILGNRHAMIARELTKKFETIMEGPLETLQTCIQVTEQLRGEFVLLVAGAFEKESLEHEKKITTLQILLKELPLKKAVSLASDLTGIGKNEMYALALTLKK